MDDIDSDKKEFYGQAFCDLDFSSREIAGKEFDNCSFESCDFSDAIFKKCEFIDCTFTKCNLGFLNAGNSKFTDIVFQDCKAIAIDWTKAYWRGLRLGSPLVFRRCMINSSSFYGLNQAKIVIEDCRAHDVDFREANCSGANFSHTDLANSLFNNTNLAGADFSEAINYDININNNVIKNAKFCRHEAIRLLESLDIKLVD